MVSPLGYWHLFEYRQEKGGWFHCGLRKGRYKTCNYVRNKENAPIYEKLQPMINIEDA